MPTPKNKKRQREIASRLLLLRERLGVNASTMARSVQLTPQRYYNYETGRRPLDADVAALVCEEHGVDYNWLYGGSVASLPKQVRKLLLGIVEAETNKDAEAKKPRRTKSAGGVIKQSKRDAPDGSRR